MSIIRVLYDFTFFIAERKLYYAFRIFAFLTGLLLKGFALAARLSLKMNADSFIFGAAFFALGFYFFGDRFRPDGSAGRNISSRR